MRFTQNVDWFEIWFEDKKAMLSTMFRNMAADLEAGYNVMGNSIRRQREDIDAYQAKFDAEMDEFKKLEYADVNRWCFYDLKKRGVIE